MMKKIGYTMITVLGWAVFFIFPANAVGVGWDIKNIDGKFGLPDSTVGGVLENILVYILAILGVLGVIGFVVSGIQYIVSYGNDDIMQNAKRNMNYSIIGIVLGLIGVVVVKTISGILDETIVF